MYRVQNFFALLFAVPLLHFQLARPEKSGQKIENILKWVET